jgi:RNA polymerase sigma-70 factor (ECF subfamily)
MSVVSEPSRQDDDQALVAAIQGGDEEAFGRLVRKYQHRVVGLARGIVADPSDAEDVAQDAFLRVYKGLAGFRGTSQFRTWLFQIVINTARSYRSRQRARVETAVDGQALEAAEGSDHVETAVVARDEVTRALSTLPVELREAVLLRDLEGLDYREIAELLGIPMGTVESRIFRGRQQLRTALTAGNVRPGHTS